MKRVNVLLKDGFYLTDGGLETTLIFQEGIELNLFAAFELLNYPGGKSILKKYYQRYLNLAKKFGTHFILESPTWRASYDWGLKLGYSEKEMKELNSMSISLLRILQQQNLPIQTVVSGNIGPRGDGYVAASCMQLYEAKEYHLNQIETFEEAGADMVSAFTMNYSDEAIGIVMAAKSVEIPVVISFTLETDGRLPNGETLPGAIERTDKYTNNYASYYMINCAHPQHFKDILKYGGEWKNRIFGIRANASTKSHAELDNSETLDPGDKCKLAEGYKEILQLLPNVRVIGGCCGTDHTHIEEISHLVIGKEQPTTSLRI